MSSLGTKPPNSIFSTSNKLGGGGEVVAQEKNEVAVTGDMREIFDRNILLGAD